MDGTTKIENNRVALKRILAMLVAMAGLAGDASTLPRRLRLAVLRLLRPAESATRRLIIAAARTLVVTLPPSRRRKPIAALPQARKSRNSSAFLCKPGSTGILLPPGMVAPGIRAAARSHNFPLLDPPRYPMRRPARLRSRGVPRICAPGFTTPFPVAMRLPPLPDDPIDATRLAQRFAALTSALDDLPGQARRFARWRTRRDAQNRNPDAAGAQNSDARRAGQIRRTWPLRLGRPPGLQRRKAREVDEVLAAAHELAMWALEHPDTS